RHSSRPRLQHHAHLVLGFSGPPQNGSRMTRFSGQPRYSSGRSVDQPGGQAEAPLVRHPLQGCAWPFLIPLSMRVTGRLEVSTLSFVVGAANLAANFARREVARVDISIGTLGLDQLHQRVEVACWHALRG